MDIKEAITQKHLLENKIHQLLTQYQEKCQLPIVDVELHKQWTVGNSLPDLLVKINIVLPDA